MLIFHRFVLVHAISYRPFLLENRFQHRAGPCVVYGGHSDMGQVYLRMIQFVSCQNNYTAAWLATGWTVRGSNYGGGEIFRTCPDRPWGPPSLLYNGYRFFLGVKNGRGVTLTPHPF